MNRFTPSTDLDRLRSCAFCDGMIAGVLLASLAFAGGFATLLWFLR